MNLSWQKDLVLNKSCKHLTPCYKLVWIRDFHFSFKRSEWDRACLCGLGYKTPFYSCKQGQRMMHNNQSSSLVQLNSRVPSFCSLSVLLATGNKLLFTNARYSSLIVTFAILFYSLNVWDGRNILCSGCGWCPPPSGSAHHRLWPQKQMWPCSILLLRK